MLPVAQFDTHTRAEFSSNSHFHLLTVHFKFSTGRRGRAKSDSVPSAPPFEQ